MLNQDERVVGISRSELARVLPPMLLTEGSASFIHCRGNQQLLAYTRLRETRDRRETNGADDDQSFKRLSVYTVFVKDDTILAINNGHTDEKVSLGLGEPIDADDISLGSTVFRGIARDISVSRHGETVVFEGPRQLMDEFSIQPVGILNDERTPVDRTRIGIACLVEPRDPELEIQLNQGSSPRSATFMPIRDLEKLEGNREIELAGWAEILFHSVLRQRNARRTN